MARQNFFLKYIFTEEKKARKDVRLKIQAGCAELFFADLKIKKVARHLFLLVTLNNKEAVERGCYLNILQS